MEPNAHSDEFRAIDCDSLSLSDDLGGIDQVFEDFLMDIGKSSRTRSLLLHTRRPCWLCERAALGDENDMLIREFLLQLACKSIIIQ